jgi:hypothetical protein
MKRAHANEIGRGVDHRSAIHRPEVFGERVPAVIAVGRSLAEGYAVKRFAAVPQR